MYTVAEYVLCVLLILVAGGILFLASVLMMLAREAARVVAQLANQTAGRLMRWTKSFGLAARWHNRSSAHPNHA